MHRRFTGIVCLAVALTCAQSAAAQDTTFRFTGEVEDISGYPFSDIALGTAIAGCYTFNASQPNDPNNTTATTAHYPHREAPAGMSCSALVRTISG